MPSKQVAQRLKSATSVTQAAGQHAERIAKLVSEQLATTSEQRSQVYAAAKLLVEATRGMVQR